MSLRAGPAFTIRSAEWARDAGAIARVRRVVFVLEQGVPEALEWEARDPACEWLLACDAAGRVLGVARLIPAGLADLPAGMAVIGRMAVLAEWRRCGIGGALLRAALARARGLGVRRLILHAQQHAAGFYARHGFVPEGEVFAEAGIPHVKMILNLET